MLEYRSKNKEDLKNLGSEVLRIMRETRVFDASNEHLNNNTKILAEVGLLLTYEHKKLKEMLDK